MRTVSSQLVTDLSTMRDVSVQRSVLVFYCEYRGNCGDGGSLDRKLVPSTRPRDPSERTMCGYHTTHLSLSLLLSHTRSLAFFSPSLPFSVRSPILFFSLLSFLFFLSLPLSVSPFLPLSLPDDVTSNQTHRHIDAFPSLRQLLSETGHINMAGRISLVSHSSPAVQTAIDVPLSPLRPPN